VTITHDDIRAHLNLSKNHECGLIPISTQVLLGEAADEIERLRWWVEFVRAQTRTAYGTTAALDGKPIPTTKER